MPGDNPMRPWLAPLALRQCDGLWLAGVERLAPHHRLDSGRVCGGHRWHARDGTPSCASQALHGPHDRTRQRATGPYARAASRVLPGQRPVSKQPWGAFACDKGGHVMGVWKPAFHPTLYARLAWWQAQDGRRRAGALGGPLGREHGGERPYRRTMLPHALAYASPGHGGQRRSGGPSWPWTVETRTRKPHCTQAQRIP